MVEPKPALKTLGLDRELTEAFQGFQVGAGKVAAALGSVVGIDKDSLKPVLDGLWEMQYSADDVSRALNKYTRADHVGSGPDFRRVLGGDLAQFNLATTGSSAARLLIQYAFKTLEGNPQDSLNDIGELLGPNGAIGKRLLSSIEPFVPKEKA